MGPVTSFKHRLAMTRLASDSSPLLETMDLEGRRAGLSYSIETLREFHRLFRPDPDLFFIMGMVLKFQSHWFFGIREGNILEFTCLLAMAWLAGFLVPGAPGGLGIRETMIVVLFSPLIGTGASIGLGVTLRMTTSLGDLVAFSVGMFMRKNLQT